MFKAKKYSLLYLGPRLGGNKILVPMHYVNNPRSLTVLRKRKTYNVEAISDFFESRSIKVKIQRVQKTS